MRCARTCPRRTGRRPPRTSSPRDRPGGWTVHDRIRPPRPRDRRRPRRDAALRGRRAVSPLPPRPSLRRAGTRAVGGRAQLQSPEIPSGAWAGAGASGSASGPAARSGARKSTVVGTGGRNGPCWGPGRLTAVASSVGTAFIAGPSGWPPVPCPPLRRVSPDSGSPEAARSGRRAVSAGVRTCSRHVLRFPMAQPPSRHRISP